MPPGTLPKPSQVDPSRSQEATFSILNFDQVLGSILAPFWLPKCLPLGTLLALKIDQENDPKSDCLEGRSKVAPRAPKTLPRCPPDPPGEPQDPPRGLLDPPRMPQEALPDPPGRSKMFSEACGPITFFGKIKKIELVEKKSKKKSRTVIHGGHPHRSSQKPKALSQRSNTEGGGGGRATRPYNKIYDICKNCLI